ncbi:helix-turn-helix transcriptional regulator [Ventrimonas sp. CLA-AP-H27]|uniref:Helix-turn-helix transcriptional regulator n=1 Tax=Ventrimonas faecis TaxID=3133170 RepID=A0ABV1HKJ7_9FIRM
MDIGTRISFFRNKKQYSVNRLATLAGISQSYLRDVELGKKNPTVEVLSYICDALDLSLRDFFDDTLESRFCQDPLLTRIYRMSPEQRNALLQFLDCMDQ